MICRPGKFTRTIGKVGKNDGTNLPKVDVMYTETWRKTTHLLSSVHGVC